jgi:hypothetical protein
MPAPPPRSLTLLVTSLTLALGCSGQTVVSLLEPPKPGAIDAAGGAPPDAALPDAAPSTRQLIHRYSFSGSGTVATDSVGGADGAILNGAMLDGAGHLTLDGSDDYVSLPSKLISVLGSASIIIWIDWAGGPCWQRLFDFGSTDAGKDLQGNATSELFSVPLRCPPLGPTVSYSTATFSDAVDGTTLFPGPGQFVPVSVILDGANAQMAFYVNGTQIGSNELRPLANIDDQTAWLGRSLWPQDLNLAGTYDELRIYDYALSDAERIAVEAAGPDALP